MNNFQRTALNAETRIRAEREKNDVKYCKEEILTTLTEAKK